MTYLDAILARRRAFIEAKKSVLPIEQLERQAQGRTDFRDFRAAVQRSAPAIVAEIKRASPSAGVLRHDADAFTTARAYARGGAAAVSVLTEQEHFRGGFDDLKAARRAVSIPVLCKDFVIDAYQVWEAAAKGADAILLIAAALERARLEDYIGLASALHLTPLVEVHDEEEAAAAISCGATTFGINNRDLRSFEVDVRTALRVAAGLPESAVVIAESGYRTPDEIAAAFAGGVHGVLIGEAFMRGDDPADIVARFRAAST